LKSPRYIGGGDKLYVADTNSHTVKVLDLDTNAIESLMLSGLEKRSAGGGWSGDTIQVTKPCDPAG
jgi:hypothetical protein